MSLCQMHYLPDEPFIEELEGKDGMEFPPPAEPPLEDEAVIPARVIDELIDASDEAVLASLNEVQRRWWCLFGHFELLSLGSVV